LSEGGFGHYFAAYELVDGLTITGGVVSYQGGDKLPFNPIVDNDRLFSGLKY